MTTVQYTDTVHLFVKNIGGIDETEIEFKPGVTVLEGRNATNRTSLLQGIMAALGSKKVSLKGDAEEGVAEMSIEGETYTRTLRRNNGTVATSGNPYLEEPTRADLFAFLLESNEARRAVARGDNLRDLIMDPVDTDAITAEIDRLEQEKKELDEELDSLQSLKRELPDLEQERTHLNGRIEKVRDDLKEKEAELQDLDADPAETRDEKAELERKLEKLSTIRSNLEDVRFDIETQEDSLDSLQTERRDLRAELDDLPDTPMGESDHIESEISKLRNRKQALDSKTTQLQSAIRLNERLLEESDGSVLASLQEEETESESVTDQLIEDAESITCWTCGSEVSQAQIKETLDQLREIRQEKIDTVRSVESQISNLSEEKAALEEKDQWRSRLEQQLDRVETEIDERKQTLVELRDQRQSLTDHVAELEAEAEALETREYGDVLELHKQTNKLEFELGQLEKELESVTEEIESIERRIEDEDQLKSQREGVQEELEDVRTRIDRIEQEAVEGFNKHMEEVLDILEYANLERIWIERTTQTVREGHRNVSKTLFNLHVIRQSQSGATYEDTIDHLSESEREVTGLVFALAGYLVHEVFNHVPFMLLDSLEAIDSERIAALIDYFESYAPYITVALLSEDAQALDDEYQYVTEI